VRFLRSGGKAAEGAPPATGPGAGICADVSASNVRIGLASSRDRDRALQLSQLAICHHRLGTRGGVPRHCSGTAAEWQALGSATASVRLTGTPSGTLPVRMRHAQPVLAFTSAARDRQQSCVGGEPPPLVLLVRKLRQGVKLVISDAVHDAAPACPDAGAATTASTLMVSFSFSPIDLPMS